jgi:hypothetical protein
MAETKNAPFFVDKEVIVLNQNGIWLSDGQEITHEATRKIFSKNLKKDVQGYFIQIQHETKYIQVEDTAYFVTRVDGEPGMGFTITLSDETQEKLNAQTLHYRPGRLTCEIKRSGNRERAKFLHAPYFDFLKHLEEDDKSYFIVIEKNRIELASK